MKLNDLQKIQQAAEILSETLDASTDEIIDALYCASLISEEEAGQIKFSMK